MNKFLLFVFCAVTAIAERAQAHDFEVDGIYYTYLSQADKTVSVSYQGSSYNEYSNEYTGNVVIPSSVTYNGTTYSVTSIGSNAFSDCQGLTSIEIPSSVTSIGYEAFSSCSGLTSIRIPSSVTGIGIYAFSDCTSLTSIEIQNGVTSIDSHAFCDCQGLTSIEIPSSVTSIGEGAFVYCTGLTSIVVVAGNSVYDSRNNCNAIIETTTNTLIAGCKNTVIPNSVTSIGSLAFYGCTGLSSIEIPSSVTSIGDYAFVGCTGLTSIEIPSSVTSIGNSAFSNCTGLTSIEIPSSVTSISDGAFIGCTGLTSIEIPSSVTGIGIYAFQGCTGLTSIEIPNSVTSIGSYAFRRCTRLTSIEIPNSVTSIGEWAFSGCTGLTSIEIPSSVTSIGSLAFEGCTGLTSIEIPSSVTSIGNWAFQGCKGLTSIEIPSSVTSIGDYAFGNCTGLTSVTVNNPTPVSISSNVFPYRANATLYVPTGSKAAYESADYWKEFKEIVEIEVLDRLIITDGEALAYDQTETHDELVYTRTFSSADKWQALYVPFSIPIDTLDKYELEVAELNDTHMYDTDEDGEFDQTTLEFLYLKRGATEPNYPYLIRAASAGDVTLTMTDVEVKATEETEIECSTTRAVFKIRGTYAGVSGAVMYANNYYAMGGGTLVRMANADSGLKPQRWYLSVENKDGSPAESLAAQMRITIDGIEIEEDVTAISEVNAIGQKQDEVYMLDGRKLNGTATLKSGLYVKNHKKLFVR
ncbi:MAG: leucine-rich repeat domain-containing protein [Bacteroidales bacterium]|nr:leucine-rich repeat domain-containing protein [Bacteroidales bacterium]